MRIVRAAELAAATFLLSACGYVGEPLPPLANIPEKVTDLAAVQRGDQLYVQFSAPQLTTEKMKIKTDVIFDLRAGVAGAPFDENAWAAQAKKASPEAENGHVQYVFPVADWTGKEIVVGVRVRGGNGKTAGWSNFLIVPVVPAPPQPTAVRAEAVPGGVRLVWQAPGSTFRVYRRSGDQPFAPVADPNRAEFTDTTTEVGKPYSYLVQTIVKQGTREAESEPSAEVSITPVDLFPPAVPAGVRAVTSTASIELAWEPDSDADLAGYRVYRAEGKGAFERLAEVTSGPSYSDRAIEPGKTYRYAVSAFDRAGNESKQSEPVEAAVP